MAKCDTPKTKKALLMDDGARDGWCRRCLRDLWHSEDEQPGMRCQECKVIHLNERCFEKIIGWLCYSCAKKYDHNLLRQMVPTGEMQKS